MSIYQLAYHFTVYSNGLFVVILQYLLVLTNSHDLFSETPKISDKKIQPKIIVVCLSIA